MPNDILTVSLVNSYVKSLIDNNDYLRNICVKGEVSNFTNHIKSGHFYFSLKDKNCSIKCIMFNSYASKVPFEVENGMSLLVTGDIKVFERDGVFQLYCRKLEPDGIGALHLAFNKLQMRLQAEGLFDISHKKPIPAMPKKIGVVTSKTGAALKDIINVLSRRYPIGEIVVIPALVQGDLAEESICKGIRLAQSAGDIDVLIVGRGGGSLEDLWCFNGEALAREIYNCTIPVISAVGHEIDFTIADFAADLRAPTPSAAAELCTMDISEIKSLVVNYSSAIDSMLTATLTRFKESVFNFSERLKLSSPKKALTAKEEKLTSLTKRLDTAANVLLEQKTSEYLRLLSTLEALSPMKVLTRGYSLTYKNQSELLTSLKDISPGDTIKTVLPDGEALSIVEAVKAKTL